MEFENWEFVFKELNIIQFFYLCNYFSSSKEMRNIHQTNNDLIRSLSFSQLSIFFAQSLNTSSNQL